MRFGNKPLANKKDKKQMSITKTFKLTGLAILIASTLSACNQEATPNTDKKMKQATLQPQ